MNQARRAMWPAMTRADVGEAGWSAGRAQRRKPRPMERRKFLLGMGAVAAGGTAALGTGAYKGANVNAERELTVGFEGDGAAYLRLNPTSPFASHVSSDQGGAEVGQVLSVTVDRLNIDADTRLNEVFRVGNTTGSDVELSIEEFPEFNGAQPDGMEIYADDGSGETRIDSGSGSSYTLGAGENVGINFVFTLLGDQDVNQYPGKNQGPGELIINAEGAE